MEDGRRYPVPCPICDGACAFLDTVDFNKNCLELRGMFLPKSGIGIDYHLCADCGFCFSPAMAKWTPEEFRARVYNDGYLEVDPEYTELRPRAYAKEVLGVFGERARGVRHLDYGSGSGMMSRILAEAGWDSTSYDPFVQPEVRPADLGRFDLVTALEVFEHVPDVVRLMERLDALLNEDGIVFLSTLLSDDNLGPAQPLTWWYAAPRNGHISLYSSRSLAFLGASQGFNFGSYSPGFHAFWRRIPRWAEGALP